MFFEIGVFKNFEIFRGKQPCWSLFLIKFQACNSSVNIAKFIISQQFSDRDLKPVPFLVLH